DPNAFAPTLGGEAATGTLFNQSINADHFYIQSEWDNGAGACSMKPVPLAGVGFTPSPGTATPGTPISFSGAAVDDYGGLGFTWTFGDGGSGSGPSPSHTFAAPGTYSGTLTVSDSGGQTASVTRSQTVNPSATASSSGSSGGASPLATSSAFGPLTATVDERTGAITFTGSLASAGT